MIHSRYRVGVDIGGTFTDLVVMDTATGNTQLLKIPSTPDDPSRAFLEIVRQAITARMLFPAEVEFLVHGTTVATNTIIESKGAKTALLTTAGFRDVLEIGRQIRPRLYDLHCQKPKPLVPRNLCWEVEQRTLPDGTHLQPLNIRQATETIAQLERAAVESVAVCFLHSYANPSHEQEIGRLLARHLPAASVTLSAEICPEMREYFRTSTAVINALIMPVVGRYLSRLEENLCHLGINTGLQLMTSSGGMISVRQAAQQPVQLVESGPAAGVTAATYVSGQIGIQNVISLDMGGTTAKVGLVENGQPKIVNHFEVGAAAVADDRAAGYPVRTPVIDLVEIGAGGGSIAWIDPGGGLRLGPQSGGAVPGPACYGRGQTEPCVTDANLVLGRIDPQYFNGGQQTLDLEQAKQAVLRLARPLGMSLWETAHGIVEIANANMLSAIRLVSVQRGFDPRDFTLVAFGGAGPLHANALARQADIGRLLIPPGPGVASALGLLVSDIRRQFSRSLLNAARVSDDGGDGMAVQLAEWNRIFEQLQAEARLALEDQGVREEQRVWERQIEMRYVGQSYELPITLDDGPLTATTLHVLRLRFLDAHCRAYGYAADDEPVEFVTARVTGVGKIQRPQPATIDVGGGCPDPGLKGTRNVYVDPDHGHVVCPIYDRYRLRQNNQIVGPAVVEEIDATTWIEPDSTATVDAVGNLLISVNIS